MDTTHKPRKTKIAGNITIQTLRGIYGESFAAGFSDNAKLKDVIEKKGNVAVAKFLLSNSAYNKKYIMNKSSKRSLTALANASVMFGAALKALADC